MRPTILIFTIVTWVGLNGPALAADIPFPAGFLWGTATAAHQVEGGNSGNTWWDWEQVPGHIKNGDKSGLAADHWNRFASDLDLARAINCNAYRFSVEWSRIEPADGVFDQAAIGHYREVLAACRQRRLTPMVTLFHFTLPRWIGALGGFESPVVVDRFARFSRRMGQELGDLVDLWCTENEPVVYALASYGNGVFPPGKTDVGVALRVYARLIEAHGKAYRALHDSDRIDADGDGRPALVGIAKHLRVFDPYSPYSTPDILAARALDQLFNRVFFHACTRGEARISGPAPGAPVESIHDLGLRGTMDYIGVNYYSRDIVKFNPASPLMADLTVNQGSPTSDLGWEIYPEGIYRTLMSLKRYNLPVFITENGVADGPDKLRKAFIRDHLHWIAQAISDGVDVRGYFHWSLMDNFEWAEGFWPRFGLYRVDYGTQARTLTEGGRFFSEVAGKNVLPGPDCRR
ncbi:MAG: glycoside hydrolase family 1 protein [Candidatus Riflebacteria bacterium]|nr:glycoside hydrolase family 1 protein [Candidatus Riflebacteria bacterium]